MIEKWIDKNLYISICSTVHKGRLEWTVGVRPGLNDKNLWLSDKDEDCAFSSFLTYESALNAANQFCEKYKPKKKR